MGQKCAIAPPNQVSGCATVTQNRVKNHPQLRDIIYARTLYWKIRAQKSRQLKYLNKPVLGMRNKNYRNAAILRINWSVTLEKGKNFRWDFSFEIIFNWQIFVQFYNFIINWKFWTNFNKSNFLHKKIVIKVYQRISNKFLIHSQSFLS